MTRTDLLPTTLAGKKEKVYEEIGELLQAMGKAGRHGYRTMDHVTGIKYDNYADILREIADVRAALFAYEANLKTYCASSPDKEQK